MFLKADVALRVNSNGQFGLNDILLKLNQCCIKGPKVWRGKNLVKQLDHLSSSNIFSELYREFINSSGFPAYDKTFKQLGIILPMDNEQSLVIKQGSIAREIMQ